MRPPDKMSLSKCALLVLILHLCVCHCIASSWTVDIPSTVKALVGSCVVIPCSFDYPPPQQNVTQLTGIWTDSTSHLIYHPQERKALVQYRNRTKLLGDLRLKNCSLKIDPVQTSDKGPYHFRIEIAAYNNYSYKQKAVSITTTDVPEPVVISVKKEVLLADSVSAHCSVSHSCPQSPPLLTWSRAGHVQVHHEKTGGAEWRTNSTLTFQASRSDHNKLLECTVSYRGGIQRTANTVLTVKYAPEIRNASSCYHEGHHVRCMCIAKSSPPSEVHLLSEGQLLDTTTERYGLLSIVTLQADIGLFSSVTCIANNTVGSTTLLLPLSQSKIICLCLKQNKHLKNLYFYITGNIYIYIGVSIGAAVLLLIILLVVVARKCSQRKRNSESTSLKHNHDLGLESAKYTAPMRKKCPDVHYPDLDYSDHTYDL
ncbi:myelin-associated glycoprotein-like isoform X2 [Boleophthalmus pectinirostris]|uniref:myelin-associated glycoprotein-like isoform X2 n=1 Tax=Boleophthalmus pectinirostris TaxID=150288 RepID=UPI000A1C41BC|nr:myelin-associated glycoprotein-like isoform X2 [Boleophthalmus pectinirostris]